MAAFETPEYRKLSESPSSLTTATTAGLQRTRTVYQPRFPAAGVITAAGVSSTTRQRSGAAILQVLMACDAGYEDAFHAWYNEEHLPALVAVPGVLHARRFINDSALPDLPDHRFLAVYE
jgi:hypothetical protein